MMSINVDGKRADRPNQRCFDMDQAFHRKNGAIEQNEANSLQNGTKAEEKKKWRRD